MTCLPLRRLTALALIAGVAAPAAAQTPLPITSPGSGDDVTVTSVPDVDGDGVGDLVVGVAREDVGANASAGKVFLYSGATGALLRSLVSPNPVFRGNFGRSVEGLPDIDGDGRGDLLIGAQGETVNGRLSAGRAYVFSGATGGLVETIEPPTPVSSGFFGYSVSAGRFGSSVFFLVGEYVNVANAIGRAHTFDTGGTLLRTFASPRADPDDRFGSTVDVLPATSAFGRQDLILIAASGEIEDGLPRAGRAYQFDFFGNLLREYTSAVPQANAFFGGDLSAVPDVTGDGVGEILVGTRPGVALYDGATSARLRTYGGAAALGSVPDLDGDGIDDHLVFVRQGSFTQTAGANGLLAVYSGATGRLVRSVGLGAFLISAAGVPDTDGDGRGDLLVFGLTLPTRLDVVLYRGASATATLAGTEGWRLLASPAVAAVSSLLSGVRTQGAAGASTGSDGDPNVFAYTEALAGTRGVGFQALPSLVPAAEVGRGYAVYVFADDDPVAPGTQGGFPKTLATTGFASTGQSVGFPVTFTAGASVQEDGWNLSGNPYDASMNWDAAGWLKTNVDNTIYVYDAAASAYRTWNGTAGSLGSGLVAPFQGFWTKANAPDPALTSPAAARTTAAPPQLPRTALGLTLSATLAAETLRDEAFVSFQDDALDGLDPFDAYKLSPLSASYASLYATVAGTALDVSALPTLAGATEVPLGVGLVRAGAAVSGEATLSWPDLADVPAEWTLTLTDTETGASVNLRQQPSYTFTAAPAPALVGPSADRPLDPTSPEALVPRPLLLRAQGAEARPVAARFVLRLARGAVAVDEGASAGAFEIAGVRPNPLGRRGTVAVRLAEAGAARLSLFDALGREVAVLADGAMAEGRHEIALDPAGLAPGVYVVRWQSGGQVAARTVTVIR